ncbi:iron complex transport system ATP-binding protein [Sporobacter termitidis DSM 10068]|uniref:Iron complex transport system ATP-binding protein n=1 Tax=Sporobacter termitidis DSM 10068 TaxID=1123282 RepID=A0A1M5UEW6_9FIRM|nr:ABC transporter ATP-binding protein [Sporobacter termitidis]SHH61507.1 iron complex transport system ATP-binding protein [Sporobacter termitidis DSM 10068]
MLDVKNLTVQYGSLKIVDSVSFSIRPQEWLMVVGPNGAGKSTVVSAIAQGVPYTGSVEIDGQDVAKLRPRDAARLFGVLTQNHTVGYSFTVEEVVRLGRYAFSEGMFAARNDEDERKLEEALELTGLTSFRTRSVLTLSGGELQRTFLAQLLAQNPRLLILDEPTNHLDLVYQKQIFELIKEWLKAPGRAVMSVVHDLNLAKAYGTHAVLLDKGCTVSGGRAGDVLTPVHLNPVYNMDVYAWMQQMLSQWREAQ